MKIAVIMEGSTKTRNGEVMQALEGMEHEVYNLGMKNEPDEPDLTYMETGLLAALLLNLKAVDFVLGGCGTGQGFMNMVLQFPGVSCGLLCDPVDAYLFSQVNAGNCVSLALNKSYGNLGGRLNVRYILEKLFSDTYGQGYPPVRREIQINARNKLAAFSERAHKSMPEILQVIDTTVLRNALSFPGIMTFIEGAPESGLKTCVVGMV